MIQGSLAGMSPLASREHWEGIADRFSGDAANLSPAEAWGTALVCVGLLGLGLLLRYLARWQERRAQQDRPAALFQELCRAHRLSKSDRALLIQIAEESALRQPSELFVRPELLAESRFPAAPAGTIKQIGALRERLFAGLDDDSPGASACVTTVDVRHPVGVA